MSYGDEARGLPSVFSVQSLERLASVEALPLLLNNNNVIIVSSCGIKPLKGPICRWLR